MERRNFIKGIGVTALSASVLPSILQAEEIKAPTSPNALSYKDALKAITGGKTPAESPDIELIAPEIAENGAVVPIKVSVKSPMTDKEYVKTIHLISTENGNSRCADVLLTPMNGEAYFSTRIKLGKSQDVVAIAQMSDGRFLSAKKSVKVTIGGCG